MSVEADSVSETGQEHTVVKPVLSAVMPSSWFYKESITLLAPDGQANVIASSEPLEASITVDEYCEVQGKLLREEFPSYSEYGLEAMDCFGSLTGYLRVFSWDPPDGVTVRQFQIYAVSNGRGYTATATVPETELDRYRATLAEILTFLVMKAQG